MSRMFRSIAEVLLCVSTFGFSSMAEEERWPELTSFDRDVLEELTQVCERPPIIFHFRAKGLSEEILEEDFEANLEAYAELGPKLEMTYEGPIHVFLYADGEEMKRVTRSEADIAFSTGTSSVHQVHDFRGVHEFTHIFALQFEEVEEGAEPDGFLIEGLATAMAASDQGVPVHSWAKVYGSVGRLPPLWEFRSNWMEAPAGVHPYHVAASFVLYLVERFGINKVKRYYRNATEAYQSLGVSFPRLERDWLVFLSKREIDSAHERFVLSKLGIDRDPIPEEWSLSLGKPLISKDFLERATADDDRCWVMRDGALTGSHDGPWTTISPKQGFPADVGVRVRFRMHSGDAFKIVLNRRDGQSNEAILSTWSTYLSQKQGGFIPNESVRVTEGIWYEVVLVNQGGNASLFLDGRAVLKRSESFFHGPGRIALGVERGQVEVRSIAVFDP